MILRLISITNLGGDDSSSSYHNQAYHNQSHDQLTQSLTFLVSNIQCMQDKHDKFNNFFHILEDELNIDSSNSNSNNSSSQHGELFSVLWNVIQEYKKQS